MERKGGKERLELGTVIVAFIGMEGSGKTDRGLQLAQETGKPYISTRKLLENLRDNDAGPLGDEVRKMFSEGVYLAGETLIEILVKRFSQEDTKDGFVLDGGFRTLFETKNFRDALRRSGRDFPVNVRYLLISEEESDRRLDARKRDDDTTEKRASRRAEFYKELPERIAAIKAEQGWSLVEIDGIGSIQEVYQRIVDSLKVDGQVL